MYATVRRYEGIDKARSQEITRKVGDSLLPSVSELPGFRGYYLIDGGETVLASIGLFENAKEAHESTRIAARGCVNRSSSQRFRTRRRSPLDRYSHTSRVGRPSRTASRRSPRAPRTSSRATSNKSETDTKNCSGRFS